MADLTVLHGERGTVTGDEIYEEIHKVLARMMPGLSPDDPSFGSLRMLARAAGPKEA